MPRGFPTQEINSRPNSSRFWIFTSLNELETWHWGTLRSMKSSSRVICYSQPWGLKVRGAHRRIHPFLPWPHGFVYPDAPNQTGIFTKMNGFDWWNHVYIHLDPPFGCQILASNGRCVLWWVCFWGLKFQIPTWRIQVWSTSTPKQGQNSNQSKGHWGSRFKYSIHESGTQIEDCLYQKPNIYTVEDFSYLE